MSCLHLFETLLRWMFFVFLNPIVGEILMASYAREERESTETAAAPPRPMVLYIPSGDNELGLHEKRILKRAVRISATCLLILTYKLIEGWQVAYYMLSINCPYGSLFARVLVTS